MVDEFLEGLTRTNKYHSFFTDWQKARTYQDVYKDELAVMGGLTGHPDPLTELTRLLKKYPRINALLPILNAVRPDYRTKSLVVLDENSGEDIQYFFADNNVTTPDIKQTLEFAKKTGLLNELTQIKNHTDYYFGVEVGLDSNARKNRSGNAMEALVEPHVRQFVTKYGGQFETQMTFEKAAKLFGVDTPTDKKKKGDFMLFVKGQAINIETNFFDGGGSKQEIMNSYIPRVEDLKQAGWRFALVTDGLGWRSNKTQLLRGFERIKHIYNIKMCTEGHLENILK